MATRSTKAELQDELRSFMVGFARSVERMYGQEVGGGLLGHPGRSAWNIKTDEARVEQSSLWRNVCAMYDYGFHGVKVDGLDLGDGAGVDGEVADVELFLRGLDSFEKYLEEDEAKLPELARRTVRIAVARNVLDGGSRYTDYDDGFFYSLSISELALLADMDERSVRNAANPKLPNPLRTTTEGKRTLVSVEDARKWLAGRKGFVPTQSEGTSRSMEMSSISLPSEVVDQLALSAAASGLSVQQFIAQHVAALIQAVRS